MSADLQILVTSTGERRTKNNTGGENVNQNAMAQQRNAPLNNPHDQTITLPDGRQLGFAEYGAPEGTPVLFFHGSPGSRHIHADMENVAERLGVRLIAVDRPGYGLSDAKHGRTLLDWADDVAALVDTLGIDMFSLIGFSMGTIYALACAYKLPQRINKVSLAGAFAPLDVPGITNGMSPAISGLFALAQANPVELKNTFAAIAPTPEALAAAMSASLGESDTAIFHARQSQFEAEYAETLRTGVEGVASDFVLNSQNWGFPLDTIKTETHLWCGTEDCNTPPAMTTYLTSALPNSQTFMLLGEGHCALYPHWEEILARLI
jgi:pimeloyl-ACP methyl ester carboxylesterase